MLSSRKLPNGVEVIAAVDYDDSLFPRRSEPTVDPSAPRSRSATTMKSPSTRGTSAIDLGYDASDLARAPLATTMPKAARTSSRSTSARPRPCGSQPFSVRRCRRVRLRKRAPRKGRSRLPRRARCRHQGRERSRGARDQGFAALARDAARELRVERFEPPKRRCARGCCASSRSSASTPCWRPSLRTRCRRTAATRKRMRALVRRFGERLPLVPGTWPTTAACSRSSGRRASARRRASPRSRRGSCCATASTSSGSSAPTRIVSARGSSSTISRASCARRCTSRRTPDDLRRVLDGFSNKKLVLIDTAGMSQRDVRLANQFTTLKVEGHSRSHRARVVGRRRSRLSRRSAQGFPGCEPGGVDRHEARRGRGARRHVVVGDSAAACRSRISPTASACPRTCIVPRRSAFGCCTTR